MTERRTILLGIACLSVALLTVKTLSQTPGSSASGQLDQERLRGTTKEEKEKEIQKWREEQRLEFERLQNMTEQEKKRYFEKKRRQRELERQQRWRKFKKESAENRRERAPTREQRKLEMEQRRKEFDKEVEEAGGIRLLRAKYALGVSEEQWKLIRPKLEKVINLWDRAISTVGASVSGGLTDSRTGPNGPRLKWDRPWEDKPRKELTEAQRLAGHLRILLEKEDTTPQVFRRKIGDLREARKEEAEIEKELAEARGELRGILTTCQEAVLVLLGWL